MYDMRRNHAADHDPACLLLPGPRRALLFMQVRRVGDYICPQAEEGRLALAVATFCVGRSLRWRTNERDGTAHTTAPGCRADR